VRSLAVHGAAALAGCALGGAALAKTNGNYTTYGGDFLGTHTMNQIWCQFLPHHDGKPVFPWPKLTSLAWWRYVWFDFWGLFGMMDKYLWRSAY